MWELNRTADETQILGQNGLRTNYRNNEYLEVIRDENSEKKNKEKNQTSGCNPTLHTNAGPYAAIIFCLIEGLYSEICNGSTGKSSVYTPLFL